MDSSSPRTAQHSHTEMTEIVLPQHTNALGTVFGGQVMAWIDICGAIAAHRHCGRVAVTAAVDEMGFLAPIHLGNIVRLEGRVNAAFRTSVEVQVVVDVEEPATGELTRCLEALLTFVLLGEDGKPAQVPELLCKTPEDKARRDAAHERRQNRLKRRRK